MKRFALFILSLSMLMLLAVLAAPASASAHCSLLTAHSAMPDQTTQRQLIVDAFKLRLAAIDSEAEPLANGYQYQTDIGKNGVERWRTNYNQDELKTAQGKAMISIFDLVRTREKEFSEQKAVVATLPVQMRVFHFREGVSPEELTKMLADVQQAAVTNPETGKRDLTLGGLATDIKPGDDGFIIPSEVFTLEGGAVSFDVEHLIEPYAQ